ncbi:TolC family outer membrane protein [Nitrincola alkalisediminis]|uniref:TolC family outer membrane protein n=1 Tax=Nitrincola alkalisediminis TaxID=1366656 RepID=UPI001FE8EAC4|nr:TolC family outer membrane protein [Nitrincola alkalisediminis]
MKKSNIVWLPILVSSLLMSAPAFSGPLQDLYRLALENDPQLKRAEAEFMAGQEAPIQGKAALLPRVDFSANTSESSNSNGRTGYSVSLSQPIYARAAYYNFRSSELSAQVSALEFNKAQQDIILRTVQNYLEVLRAKSVLENAQAQERALQRRLDQVNAQFEVGLIAITDVQEALASFDNAVVQRIDAEGALQNSFEALERLTGQAFNQVGSLRAEYPIVAVEPADPSAWLEKALEGNLELQIVELQVDSSRRNVQSKRSEHLPTVSVSLTHSNARTHGGNSNGWSDDNTLALNLNLPLYRGDAINSAQRQAEHQFIATGHALDDTQRAVTESTRTLLRTLQTSVQSVKAREQSILSRETALRATEEGFNVGTRNVVDVLQAEQALFEARLAYSNARIDHVNTLFRFKQTLGTLSPEDVTALDNWLLERD